MPQEIPTRTPNERVRRFAESLYNLKTDRVQASDFLEEANEVLIQISTGSSTAIWFATSVYRSTSTSGTRMLTTRA